MSNEDPPLLRPIPRRPFETYSSAAPSPNRTQDFASQLEAKLRQSRTLGASAPNDNQGSESADGGSTPSRNKSILNLTASTLFGIYSPTEREVGLRGEYSEPQTPWGTGAETPSLKEGLEFGSPRQRVDSKPPTTPKQAPPSIGAKVVRILTLFVFGVSYGVIIEHLHDQRHMAPVQIEGLNHHSMAYRAFWGLAGVGWGLLLPWFDIFWERRTTEPRRHGKRQARAQQEEEDGEKEGVEFLQVVRLIGGFIGIAFAARKLAWRSTLQASITLSLVNPALWYLFDRTKAGFTLSAGIGIAGTMVLLLINPDMVPPPANSSQENPSSSSSSSFFNTSRSTQNADALLGGVVSYESIGVATWIASVLFCSCICFGNIGRRLRGWVKAT